MSYMTSLMFYGIIQNACECDITLNVQEELPESKLLWRGIGESQ